MKNTWRARLKPLEVGREIRDDQRLDQMWLANPPCRYSDSAKICISLNHPQGCKMSEWVLSAQRNSTTSKLNTRFDSLDRSGRDFNDLARSFKPPF